MTKFIALVRFGDDKEATLTELDTLGELIVETQKIEALAKADGVKANIEIYESIEER